MKSQRKLKTWKYKNNWPIIREVRRGDKIKYKVDTTSRLSRRQQPVRETKAEAEILCEQYCLQLKNDGVKSFKLSASEQEDASDALELAKGMGFDTLKEAMLQLKGYHNPAGGSISVQKLREEFLAHHLTKIDDKVGSTRTYEDLSSRTDYMEAHFGSKLVKELTPDGVWSALKELKASKAWSRRSLKNCVRTWLQLLNFAVKKEYIAMNPLLQPRIQFEIDEATKLGRQKPPAVLTAEQSRALLLAAYNHKDPNMLPIVAVMLFAGLRPGSEALKLTWDDFDWKRNCIGIGGDRSKCSVSARRVTLRPVLLAWLQRCNKTGSFLPSNWKRKWKAVRDEAGITQWVEDYTRHTFASYSWAEHGDDRQLETELGHIRRETKEHYRQVSPAVNYDCEKFWNLTPESVLEGQDNVIQMEEAG